MTWHYPPEDAFLDAWQRPPPGARGACDLVSMVGITDMPGRSSSGAVVAVERDLDGNALHHLGEIAGGVVRRQQREFLAAGGRDAVDAAVHDLAGEHVDGDVDRLALAHVGQLGFLEVRHHIGAGDRHHRHQLRAGLHELADAQRAVADDAVDRRDDGGVVEIELGLALHGFARAPAPRWPERSRP